ncbi:MAG: methylated-DNA--[protein]-cysteine S-methyltransferase [Gammaproteobacteria bacterium]|nr:methylated-DNA--[protein]-cysteine S-methyltransferase [Gammaproteobacteria bacterium]
METVSLDTPIGFLQASISEGKITSLDFSDDETGANSVRVSHPILQQLQRYFEDPRFPFAVDISPQGTEYQQRVWDALRQIPVGSTITYGELAKRLGSSARAIGNACRKNPVPLIVPCHRVVSQKGIGGFMGQVNGKEIAIKQWLLRHEGVEY